MVQEGRAFFLKNPEVAVLLSVKGMERLYGIRMENIQNLDRSEVYRTLFELEKNRLVSLEDGRIAVRPELELILEDIRDAEVMLSYASAASEYPDQCIYLGRQAVLVSVYGTAGEISRLEGVEIERLPERVYECGFCLEEIYGGLNPDMEPVDPDPILIEQVERLFGREYGTLQKEDWGIVVSCLRMLSIRDRRCVRQYLLLKDRLRDYISVTDEDATCLYDYSKEKLIKILADDFRSCVGNRQEGARR